MVRQNVYDSQERGEVDRIIKLIKEKYHEDIYDLRELVGKVQAAHKTAENDKEQEDKKIKTQEKTQKLQTSTTDPPFFFSFYFIS